MPRVHVPIFSVIRPRTALSLKARLVPDGDCLVFTGTRNKAGYGFIDVTYDCKRIRYPILTHRLAWVLAHGQEIPDDRIICHRCNNPPCCNPEHLYLGTHQDNADDMEAAGTRRSGHRSPMKGVKGERHPASKYTDEQRMMAVQMKNKGMSFKDIAEKMGCMDDTVSRWWNQHLEGKLHGRSH